MAHQIRTFQPVDQQVVFDLILSGLGQRFDEIRPEYNPDIYDIQRHYLDEDASFIVVEDGGHIIGCGALVKEDGSDVIARIVRVSVRTDQQGKGLGRMMSMHLIDLARKRGFSKVLVETNSEWTSALRLYQSCGFTETHRVKSEDFDFVEVHMELAL